MRRYAEVFLPIVLCMMQPVAVLDESLLAPISMQ